MNYIVLDMEWNMPFSFKNVNKKAVPLHGEIIQIGAVKLDENYQTIDTFEIMVAPKYYTKMQSMVEELTGITDEDLKNGFPFPFAIDRFKKWCGTDFVFLIWGMEDIDILRSNMKYHRLSSKWIPATYNIQVIYDGQIGKESRQCSLTKAMERIGEPVLKAHDALNDAKSTAIICRHLDMEKGLAEYDKLEMKMRWNAFDIYCSPKTYWKAEHSLKDASFLNFQCPICGSAIESKEYVPHNGKYIGVGTCGNGDELLVKLVFKKEADKKYRVIRLLYEMNEENRELHKRRKQKAQEAYAAYMEYAVRYQTKKNGGRKHEKNINRS